MMAIMIKILPKGIQVPFLTILCAVIVFVIIPILDEMRCHNGFHLLLFFPAREQVQHCISNLPWSLPTPVYCDLGLHFTNGRNWASFHALAHLYDFF